MPDPTAHETLTDLSPRELRSWIVQLFRESAADLQDRRAQYWCDATLLLTGILLVSMLVIAYLATRSEVMPYVVVYDPQGALLWHGEPGSVSLEAAWIGTWLQEWLGWCRGQPDDVVVFTHWRHKCSAMVLGQAARLVDDYFQRTDPRRPENATNRMRVQLAHESIAHEGGTIYRLTWREVFSPTYGTRSETYCMSGVFKVELRNDHTVTRKEIAANPRRLFVTEILSWAPITGGCQS